jgi:hypothetical protein
MFYKKKSIFGEILSFTFLFYLALLPISGMIALRNFVLLILVIFTTVVIFHYFLKNNFDVLYFKKIAPWLLFVWCIYLLLFPLISIQSDVAWQNLRGQWSQSMLAWIVGMGIVVSLSNNGPSVFSLALASSVPLLLHLSLAFFSWVGLLNIGQSTTIDLIFKIDNWNFGFYRNLDWLIKPFPMGFRGIEPMHGNLGYTACQAIALFGVSFGVAWRDRDRSMLIKAGLAIVICFSSILVAYSRGAVVYALFILVFLIYLFVFKCKLKRVADISVKKKSFSILSFFLGGVTIFLIVITAFNAFEKDERWHSMFDKVKIGYVSKNPLDILCNGVTQEIEDEVNQNFLNRDSVYRKVLIDGLKMQDGGRVLLMRAGFDLMIRNPIGLDGSRYSFQKLLREKCGHEPVLQFSHSHQGWLDLGMALGWIGVFLYAALLLYFLFYGLSNLKNSQSMPWALAISLISSFWLLRGFADSVYREHYLQMQAVLLAYLYGRLLICRQTVINAPKDGG